MSFKFDAQLIPNVLTDQGFQSTGLYTGLDQGIHYAVIDPRRHNVDVWARGAPNPHHHQEYRRTALRNGAHFATNGPMMAPPTGSGRLALAFWVIVTVVLNAVGWIPFDRVVHRRRVLGAGAGIVKSYFSRVGQGSFGSYGIGYGSVPPGADEGLSGLVRLVANGSTVTDADTPGIQAAIGIATWGLRPVPSVPTDGWQSEVVYLDPGEADELSGLLVAAASDRGGVNVWMATGMLAVGCTEAVAMDGSDSVVCVSGGAMMIACTSLKDDIQRWGLACK